MSTNKSVASTSLLIGSATLTSRILGFLRDIVIARLFGIYVYAQAFVVAFRIPNLLRDFVGEGASNAAFVPVFTEYSLKHSKEEFWELANVLLNFLLIGLAAITLLGIVSAPLLVRLIAPGFISDPYKLEATVSLTRIIFPYIILIALTAYTAGILNSLKHFSLPAFSPCLLNISIIVFVLLFGEGIKGLALGVLIGGILQLAVQLPVLYKKGFRLRLFRNFKHPAAKIIGRLMLPRILSTSLYQLNNFLDSIFGSLAWIVGEGAVAGLYFSYRLIQFPLGIFSNALAQAVLPVLSTQALEENYTHLKDTLSFALRATFFVTLPSSVAFMVLGKNIILTLFGGGRFDSYSVEITAGALSFYSFGLFAYGAIKILNSCFFALKDTLTPAKTAFFSPLINVILNSILMFPLKIKGLALATSISGIFTFFFLFIILKKRLGDFKVKGIIISFLRILLASICMGVVCYFAGQIINLWLVILLGVLSYIFFCFFFRVSEMQQLWQWVRNGSKR